MVATVRRLSTAELTAGERSEIRELLDAAFAHDEGGFGDLDWAHALGGTHAVVEVDGGIVAHASVVPRIIEIDGRGLRTGYLEAVATHPDEAGRGYGSMAVRALNEVIRATYELGALSTGVGEFYARLGWEPWRGRSWVNAADGPLRTDDEDGSIMILRTPATPPLDMAAAIACDWRDGDVW